MWHFCCFSRKSRSTALQNNTSYCWIHCFCVPGCWSLMPRSWVIPPPSVWLSRKANPSFRTYWEPKSAMGNNKGKVIKCYQNLSFPMGIMPGNMWLGIGEMVLCQDSWNQASRIWSGFSLLWGWMKGADKAWGEGRLGGKLEQCIGGILLCVQQPCISLGCSVITWGMWRDEVPLFTARWAPAHVGVPQSSLICTQGLSVWQPARWCCVVLGEEVKMWRCEGQEWEDRLLLQREVPLYCHHQPSAFLMRERSSLFLLQSIQQKNTAVLRESKSPLLSLAHIARPRMLKSASYPKGDVSSVVLWMYWAKYMCTTSSCRTPPQRWLCFSGEITLECASHPNINPT